MIARQTQKFAFFDLAQTLAPGYFISSFNLFLTREYLKDRYEELLAYDEYLGKMRKSHEISYNEIVDQIIAKLASLLEGQKVELIKKYAREYIKERQFFPYVEPLFKYLYSKGFSVNIITADFDFVIETFLAKLPQGFKLFPSKMEVKDGVFTGKVELVHNSNFKLETIKKIENSIPSAFAVAFGDSQGDIPMRPQTK